MHDTLDASVLGEDTDEIDEAAQDEVNRVLYEVTDGACIPPNNRQTRRGRRCTSAHAIRGPCAAGRRGRYGVDGADAKGSPGATARIDARATVTTWAFQLVKYMWTLRPSIREWPTGPVGLYVDENLVTERVASAIACFDSSPGRIKRTAVWISREEMVLFLL